LISISVAGGAGFYKEYSLLTKKQLSPQKATPSGSNYRAFQLLSTSFHLLSIPPIMVDNSPQLRQNDGVIFAVTVAFTPGLADGWRGECTRGLRMI
jgi:hypothetical protein